MINDHRRTLSESVFRKIFTSFTRDFASTCWRRYVDTMALGNVVFDSGIYGAGVATAVVMNLAVGF